ncbi:hypothetical protein PBRA_000892 [Plasmodiophora brassicae]|nr:hypothetical protein PBRA_000892 [Plasmodiophora brassicae]
MGTRAIHILCRYGFPYIDILQALVDNGAALNLQDNYGFSAFAIMASHPYVQLSADLVSKWIHEHGLDLSIKTNLGATPLVNAIASQSLHGLSAILPNIAGHVDLSAELDSAKIKLQEIANLKPIPEDLHALARLANARQIVDLLEARCSQQCLRTLAGR